MIAWLAKLAATPFVTRLLLPALRDGVAQFFEEQAKRHEVRAAVSAAKSAKTVEELKDASRKLSDSTRR